MGVCFLAISPHPDPLEPHAEPLSSRKRQKSRIRKINKLETFSLLFVLGRSILKDREEHVAQIFDRGERRERREKKRKELPGPWAKQPLSEKLISCYHLVRHQALILG